MKKLAFLLASLSFSACGPSPSSWIEERRVSAEAKLSKVAQAHELSKAASDLAADPLVDPGPLSLCDVMIPPFRDEPCNTWVINEAQLANPFRYLDHDEAISFGQAEWYVLTQSLLKTGAYPPNEKYPQGAEVDRVTRQIEYAFKWLDNMRYLFIVESYEFAAPSVTPDQKAYNPGAFRGRARLYALEPQVNPLGSFDFRFDMSGDIRVTMRQGKISQPALEAAFSKAVRDLMARDLPGHLKNLEIHKP